MPNGNNPIPLLPLPGPPVALPPVPQIGPIPPIIPIPANLQNLFNFLIYFNGADLTNLMQTLTSNPVVGITSYGPQFIGYSAVQRLFRQLFSTFKPLKLTPQGANPDWMFNTDSSVIGVQMNLSGLQVGAWFAAGTPYYSPPLSTIVPSGTRSVDLDACVIFYLDNAQNLIKQISIYFDRYLMQQQLTPT
jgi:hypothetical protein